jgi:hypothetical protein
VCFAAGIGLGAPPVSVIRQPLLTNPEIIDLSAGVKLTVKLIDGSQLTKAVLTDGNKDILEFAAPVSHDVAANTYDLSLPATAKPGLYGLKVTATAKNGEKTDFQPRSVWITGAPANEIKFAYLSDSHVGDPRAFMSKSVLSPTERRLKVYGEAVSGGAQFLIMAGDLVSVPVNLGNEYPEAYKEILDNITIPVFPAPGNHDLYAMSDANPKNDGLAFWHNYFGPDYYSFHIGNFMFIALNTFNWPQPFRNFMNQSFMNKMGSYTEGVIDKTQYEWLKANLIEAKKNNYSVICFGHHNLINSFAGVDKGVTPDLMTQEDIMALLEQYDVRYYLAGHNHQNTEKTVGNITFMTVTSASSQITPGDSWGYDLCTIAGRSMKCDYVPVVFESK